MEIDLRNKCRVCLSEDEQMHNLSNEFDEGITLIEIFTSTTTFEIEEEDGLSYFMCKNCVNILIDFYNLKTIYVENHCKIKTLLANAEECNYKNLEEDNDSKVYLIDSLNVEVPVKVKDIKDNSEVKIEVHTQVTSESGNVLKENSEESLEKEILIGTNNSSPTQNLPFTTEVICLEQNAGNFSCTECGDTFLYAVDAKNHLLTEHQITLTDWENLLTAKDVNHIEVISKCKICNEEFTNSELYKKHLSSHKKNVCEICGASFIKKSYLEDHKEVHLSDKRHICSFCNKAFKRRTVLAKHKKIHTHPRQCICEKCGKAFNDRSTLNTHRMLVHVKARNFPCMICNVKFSLKSTLEKHIRRHENKEREFFCTQCPLGYKDKSSLDRHTFVKHSGADKRVVCTECGKKYTTPSNLYKHRKVCHNISDNVSR